MKKHPSPLRVRPNLIIFLLTFFVLTAANAQYYRITNDSILAKSEMILENHSKEKTGAFLKNRLNGRTEFAYATDSSYISHDTMFYHRGDGWKAMKLPVLYTDSASRAANASVFSLQKVTDIGAITTKGISVNSITAGSGKIGDTLTVGDVNTKNGTTRYYTSEFNVDPKYAQIGTALSSEGATSYVVATHGMGVEVRPSGGKTLISPEGGNWVNGLIINPQLKYINDSVTNNVKINAISGNRFKEFDNVSINSTYRQGSVAPGIDLSIVRNEDSVGSGEQMFIKGVLNRSALAPSTNFFVRNNGMGFLSSGIALGTDSTLSSNKLKVTGTSLFNGNIASNGTIDVTGSGYNAAIKRTGIANGDLTYLWEASTTDPTLGHMRFGSSVESWNGINSHILTYGYNQAVNGSILNPEKDSIGFIFNLETKYDDGSGHPKLESYQQYSYPGGYKRLMFHQIDRVTHKTTAFFLNSDVIKFFDDPIRQAVGSEKPTYTFARGQQTIHGNVDSTLPVKLSIGSNSIGTNNTSVLAQGYNGVTDLYQQYFESPTLFTMFLNGSRMMSFNSATTTAGPAGVEVVNIGDYSTVWSSYFGAPNLTTGHMSAHIFGKAKATNNAGVMGFAYSASGSTSNSIAWGFYANDKLMNLFASGELTVGTSSPTAGVIADFSSTTKGVLLPRMTAAQKNAISSPATSLLVYQTDSTGGFYVRTSTGLWKRIVEERVTAPTVALGANITGSVALSAGSTDSKGTVTVTVTGISSLATLNELFTLTFSSAFAATPIVVYSNASSQAAALQFGATGLYIKNSGTSSFQIATNGSYTTPASATYTFNYQVQ